MIEKKPIGGIARWTWGLVVLAPAIALSFCPPATAQTTGDAESAARAGTDNTGNDSPEAGKSPIPTKDLLDIIREGGYLMYPIGLCSLILVAFVFERTLSLRRGRIIPRPFVTRFLEQMREGALDRQTALDLCKENGSPVADVFAGAVRKWGRPGVEVEQAIIDAGERVTNGLRRYLRVINGVATVSPLLGLLGTVLGMIRAFNSIATANAMGAELVAKGISEALLTTAAGLSVAIPALIFYLFFISRVDRLIIQIDALGQELVALISAEELQAKGAKTGAAKSGRKSNRGSAA